MKQRIIPRSNMLTALEVYEKHLFNLLPLYSPSGSGRKNQVIQYCEFHLKKIGRKVYRDRYFNLISPSPYARPLPRAMVAHTDAVGDLEKFETHQSIKYNPRGGIIYNNTGIRPMGGDDKVGVAIALTMVELMPELQCWLVADEEIGCVGSNRLVDVDPVDFALQFDRRGAIDMVYEIGGTKLTSKKTTEIACRLLPHRRPVTGMSTDVGALVRRKIAKNAFNMSCGYYNPHHANEFIVLNEAHQAMMDCVRLQSNLFPEDLVSASEEEAANKSTSHYRGGQYDGRSGSSYVPPKSPSSGNTTPIGTGGIHPENDFEGWPDMDFRGATGGHTQQALPLVAGKGSQGSSATTSSSTSAKHNSKVPVIKREDAVITYEDNRTLEVLVGANAIECISCADNNDRFVLVDALPFCEDCASVMSIAEMEAIGERYVSTKDRVSAK